MNKKQKVLLTSTLLVLLIIASMPIAMAASYDFSVSPNNDYVYLGLSEEEGYFEFSYIPYGDYELYLLGKKNSMSWMIGKATVSVVSSEVQNVTINWVVADSNNMTEVNYCWGLVNYFGKLEPVIYPLDPDSPTIKGDLNVPDGFITTVYLVRVNQHPYAPELSSAVDTTNLTAADPLTVKVTGPKPADPNRDSVTYSYDWFVNTGEGYVADEEAGRKDHTTATVRPADTRAGDVWKVQVTATDYYRLQSQTVSEFEFPELEASLVESVKVNTSVKISCITVDDDSTYMVRKAVSALNLTDQGVNISVYGFSRDDTVNMSYIAPENVDLSDSDIIVLLSAAMSSQSAEVEDDLIAIVEETRRDDATIIDLGNYGLGTVNLTEYPFLNSGAKDEEGNTLPNYWEDYYDINTKRMLMYILLNFWNGTNGHVEDPISVPMNGIYHPDMGRPSFEKLEEYMEWYSTDDGTHHVYNQNNTTIGITFMLNTNGDIGDRAVDDLIRRLEARGVNVIPVHCHWMLYMSTSDYFKYEDKWLVDAFIDMGFGAMATSAVYNIEDLEEANVPVINAIEYEGTIEEWENSTTGRSYYFQYQIPIMEIGGEIESIVVSGKKYDEEYDAYVDEPIPAQMEWMVNRTMNWIKLKSTENEDRKVALIYYHNSPGRDSVTTATNLNSPRSIAALLEGMEERGYTLGNNGTPNEKELLELIEHQGRNIGSWAPNELETIVNTNETELMPVDEYLEMFSRLPESCQNEVTEIWGEAPGNLMVYTDENNESYFVFPKITLGNVILTPQPTRGGTNNSTILYHDQTTPPDHHYIAFYLWLQKQYEADVVIHFGQHGTQEWLKGKGVGLSATEDWPAIVIGDMPVVYIYNVGGISEGSIAKRRGNCVIVDHATPAIMDAGLYGNLTNLHDKIHLYEEADKDNESIKYDYRESIIELYDSLGFANNEWAVSVEALTEMTEEEFEAFVVYGEVHTYLHKLASENIWFGLHTLGKNLEGENLTAMVQTMLGSSFKENVAEVYEGDDELLEAANKNNTLNKMLADLLLNDTDPEEILQTHLNVTPRAYSTVAGVTNTDENGSFSFTNLEGGEGVNYTVYALEKLSGNEYLIGEILPEINESENTVCDVEMNYATGQEYNGIMANLSDFGDASLSGHVFYISGMSEEEEVKTLENMTILLLQDDSVVAVDRTDANGNFSFINLPAGTYTLNAYYYWNVPEMKSQFYFVDKEITEHELEEGESEEDYQLQIYSSGTEAEYNELLSLTDNASLSGQAYYTSEGERVNSTALIILGKEAFGYTVKEQKVMDDLETAITYAVNLEACEKEIDSVLDALEGQYISPALGDDPIRSPLVLPTGNNFYAFNPYLIPSEETWNQGVELADEFLKEWKEENDGEYPTKIGFVLWSAETLRHKGVMESEILYLMGVRPVWENGVFSDVEIIPDEELTHPRIDVVVTFTGVYRDTWELQVKMMDRAVAKVSELDESDSTWHNYVKENSDNLYEYLNGTGNYTQEEAKDLSMDRVFGPDIGMYEVGSMGSAMSQSDTWNGNDSMLAELYLSNMAYVYGEDVWGQHEPELFKRVLSGTKAILFSRSGNDGRGSSGVVFDHVTTFYGGLALAIKEIDGEYPEMYIVDLRDTENMETVTFVEYLYTELRSKYNNPTYISGLMGEGYAGAAEIVSMIEALAALDHTTGAVTDDMWQQIYDTYVLDSNGLGLEGWFTTYNPHAIQSVVAYLTEQVRLKEWDASAEVLENLANKYLESKEKYGPCCCFMCCGNVLLDDYANGHATSHQVLDNPSNDISSSSSGGSSTGSAEIVPANNNENQESMSNQSSNANDGGYGTDTSLASTPDNHVEGNIMQSETTANQNSQSASGGMSASGVAILGTVAVLLILTVFYMGFRRN
ncbi:cobaltochelatase subunit CobN [uncultured Methanolobus sp.]|uniref:cobaltochelatase subunit CobN n=1 Tax=uncultured Methanolobus sp. TaxID=218300 RepID=UPI002AAC3C6A|nr:cobaltochelatase subunit CobN [uncultured Methanolobus sp.]